MCEQERVTDALTALGSDLRRHTPVKERVLERITGVDAGHRARPLAWYRTRPVRAVAGLAACLLLVLALSQVVGGDDAQAAFTAAINRVHQARTFSCREICETTRDGRTHVDEMVIMFKEPDLARYETLAGVPDKFIGSVSITDYAQRRELHYRPSDRSAALADLSSNYVADRDTGELELTQLDTGLRDRLLRWRDRAVEDLGTVELDGRPVRLLQSRHEQRVIRVWLDPQSDLPVQIVLDEPGRTITYASIQIDTPLDDELFSLEPPEGYTMFRGGLYKPWPDDVGRVYAKMRQLSVACYTYAEDHDGRFPASLTDLDIPDDALARLLAAPDQPDGPPVIRYRQPGPEADWSTHIMLYEDYGQYPDRGIAVTFLDGHGKVITPEQFEELMP